MSWNEGYFSLHLLTCISILSIIIALPPEIRTPPVDVQAVDGQQVNLTCQVFGAPKPRITWIKDNVEKTGGRFHVTKDGNLVIKYVWEWECVDLFHSANTQ